MKGLIKQVLVDIKDFFTLKTIDELEVLYHFVEPPLHKLGLEWFKCSEDKIPDKRAYLKALGLRESMSVNKINTDMLYTNFRYETLMLATRYAHSKLGIFEAGHDDKERLVVEYLEYLLAAIRLDLIDANRRGAFIKEYRIHLSFASKPTERWLDPHVYEDIFSSNNLESIMSDITEFLRRRPFNFEITNKLFDNYYDSTIDIYIPYKVKDRGQWKEHKCYEQELKINRVY